MRRVNSQFNVLDRDRHSLTGGEAASIVFLVRGLAPTRPTTRHNQRTSLRRVNRTPATSQLGLTAFNQQQRRIPTMQWTRPRARLLAILLATTCAFFMAGAGLAPDHQRHRPGLHLRCRRRPDSRRHRYGDQPGHRHRPRRHHRRERLLQRQGTADRHLHRVRRTRRHADHPADRHRRPGRPDQGHQPDVGDRVVLRGDHRHLRGADHRGQPLRRRQLHRRSPDREPADRRPRLHGFRDSHSRPCSAIPSAVS